ncbi:MAG: diguanylate cyclase [Eubacteriales bacterium]
MVFLSNRDYLTGLYNRRYFETELGRLDHADNLPLAVIMGDINGVKLVNDAFGHAEGDRMICECASIIQDCCRAEDTLARIGGDEFGIIMPRTDNTAAHRVIVQIQEALKRFDDEKFENHFQHSVALGFGIKSRR